MGDLFQELGIAGIFTIVLVQAVLKIVLPYIAKKRNCKNNHGANPGHNSRTKECRFCTDEVVRSNREIKDAIVQGNGEIMQTLIRLETMVKERLRRP